MVSTPLKHMTSSVGMMIYSQLNGKIKHVPKHQPDTVCLQLSYVYHYVYYLDVYRSPQKFHMLDVPLKGPRQSQLPLFVTENSPGLRKQPAPQQGQSAVAMGSSWSPPAGRWTLPAVQRGPCALQPDADPEHWGSWRWEFSCLAKWSGWSWGKQNARIWLGETKHSSTIHPGYLREKWRLFKIVQVIDHAWDLFFTIQEFRGSKFAKQHFTHNHQPHVVGDSQQGQTHQSRASLEIGVPQSCRGFFVIVPTEMTSSEGGIKPISIWKAFRIFPIFA